jgi:hypothetical protein
MPRKPRQSRQNLTEQERRIRLAINALEKDEIPSIRRKTEVFIVPYTTVEGSLLRGHLRGRRQKRSVAATPTQPYN